MTHIGDHRPLHDSNNLFAVKLPFIHHLANGIISDPSGVDSGVNSDILKFTICIILKV